ncbi:S-adenosylmethionine decarboxylase [Siccirubricoccus deserti]
MPNAPRNGSPPTGWCTALPAEYAFGEGQEGNVACVLAESHLSIHTWPHRPAATAAARAV